MNTEETAQAPTRLTLKEAALYLGIAAQTLYDMRWANTGPGSYKIANRVFYDVADLNAYIASERALSFRGGPLEQAVG